MGNPSARGRFWQPPSELEEYRASGTISGGLLLPYSSTPTTESPHYTTNLGPKESLASYSFGFRFTKRAFDIVFSLLMIMVCLVPSLILALVIIVDSPGAPIFRQRRIGQHGREIKILKFRTMFKDAHANPEKYFTPEQLDTWKREQKVDNDPRITRVGSFLRRTSLDELPQFVNVLFGSMSVVGCRPVTYEETLNFGADRDLFLSLRPGITGWWQVTERNGATWDDGSRQMVELHYPRSASIKFDSTIVAKTVATMLRKTGM